MTFNDGLGDIDVSVLPKAVRRDLESLAPHTRARVERWLAAAGMALAEDPDQAYQYAKQAGRIGGRSAVVREAVGIAAYATGDFKAARTELQAAYRMSANKDLIPLLADCERGLGNPLRALEWGDSPQAKSLRGDTQAELLLVIAGARRDLGENEAARALLHRACLHTKPEMPWAARLFYGYADALAATGDTEAAKEWFAKCLQADAEDQTDAEERLMELLEES